MVQHKARWDPRIFHHMQRVQEQLTQKALEEEGPLALGNKRPSTPKRSIWNDFMDQPNKKAYPKM